MSKISFEELDGLTGEMLPERAVLSAFSGGNGGGGQIVHSPLCTTQQSSPAGLLATVAGVQSQHQICHAAVTSSASY